MKTRFIVALIMAGSVAAAAAQDPPSRPDQKAAQAQTQTVTVTGCLQAASTAGEPVPAQQTPTTSAPQYILAQAKLTNDPTAATGTAGTTGSLATADKFRLIGGKADMKEHLNHRVEITGTLQPRSERGQAKGEGTPQKPSSEADLPTLRVTSFKHVAATCGPDAL